MKAPLLGLKKVLILMARDGIQVGKCFKLASRFSELSDKKTLAKWLQKAWNSLKSLVIDRRNKAS
jgi:hypothetical protein